MDQPVSYLIDMAQVCAKREARQAVFSLWMKVEAKFAERFDYSEMLKRIEQQGQPRSNAEEAERRREILEWSPEGV